MAAARRDAHRQRGKFGRQSAAEAGQVAGLATTTYCIRNDRWSDGRFEVRRMHCPGWTAQGAFAHQLGLLTDVVVTSIPEALTVSYRFFEEPGAEPLVDSWGEPAPTSRL